MNKNVFTHIESCYFSMLMDKDGGMPPTLQGRPSSSPWLGNADHNSSGVMGSIEVITILNKIVHKHTQNLLGH